MLYLLNTCDAHLHFLNNCQVTANVQPHQTATMDVVRSNTPAIEAKVRTPEKYSSEDLVLGTASNTPKRNNKNKKDACVVKNESINDQASGDCTSTNKTDLVDSIVESAPENVNPIVKRIDSGGGDHEFR